jgi:hypothetical protein
MTGYFVFLYAIDPAFFYNSVSINSAQHRKSSVLTRTRTPGEKKNYFKNIDFENIQQRGFANGHPLDY